MTAQSTLNLNFAQARFPDPRITFTRASTGTYIDALGRVRTAAVNQPRFEWGLVSGQCLGLLIEEGRTNALLWSQAFDNATWGKNRATVVPNAAAAPDGTMTAAKLVEDTSTDSTHDMFQNYAVTGPVTVSVSIYAKAAGRSQFSFRCADPSFIGRAFFNLDTGTLGEKDPAVTSHAIEPVGDGWYRCSATFTTRADGTIANFQIQLSNGAVTYTGDGVSGIYIWGAQLEQGSFPTSYIKTEDAPATREADSPVIPVTTFPFNPSEGTLIAEVNPGIIGVEKTVAMLTDGTLNEQIRLLISNTGQPRVRIRTGNVDIFYPAFGPISEGRAVIAGSWSEQGCHFAVNGNVTSGAGAVPQVSDLYPGRFFNNTSPLNGHISRLLYFPRALDAATLARLTA